MSKNKILLISAVACVFATFVGLVYAACNSEENVQYDMEIDLAGNAGYYCSVEDAQITATINITPAGAGADTNISVSWNGVASGSTNVGPGDEFTVTVTNMTPSSSPNDKTITFTATNSSDDYEDPDDTEDDGYCWATNTHSFTIVKVDIVEDGPLEICRKAAPYPLLLTNSYSPTYEWDAPEGVTITQSNNTFFVDVSGATPGSTNTVTISSGELSTCSDSIDVIVKGIISISRTDNGSDPIPAGETATFSAQTYPSDATVTWSTNNAQPSCEGGPLPKVDIDPDTGELTVHPDSGSGTVTVIATMPDCDRMEKVITVAECASCAGGNGTCGSAGSLTTENCSIL